METADVENPREGDASKLRQAMPLGIMWGALEILKFAYRGEKKVKLERDTASVEPVSAKPPPPAALPSTYSRDRAAERAAGIGKGGFTRKVEQRKRSTRWRKDTDEGRSGESVGGKSLFHKDIERRKVGAIESTTRELVSAVRK